MRTTRWVVAFVLALSVTTCVETTDPTLVPTTLTITPSAPFSLTAIGATRQLMAVATAANGDTIRDATVAWSTSSATVVTVSTTGLATAIGNGNATVVATVDNLTASITVTVAQVAAQAVKVSGDAQTDTVNHTLPQPIVVQVNDATGHAMTGVSVAFAVAAGSGSVGSTATMTNASGQAQTTWTLGTTAGSQTANATVGTLPVQSFAATATAGAPASVAKLGGDGQTAGNGQAVAVPPVVIVRDAFNNPTPGVAVTFATTPGNGSVADASQTTNAAGIATVGGWTLGNTGTDTLLATVTGSGISGNPAVFTAVSTAPPPVSTTIELSPATPFALTAIGATRQIAAVVTDQNGNPVGDASVTWTTSNAAAVSVDATGLAMAVANGSADVTATSGSLTASVTVTVAQAAAQVVKVSGDAQSETVDQALPLPLVVQVNDANGHPIEGVNVGFSAAAGSGSVGSAAAMTNVSGQAQTTWTLGTIAGEQSASATVGALPVQSFTATATPGAPASVATEAGDFQTAGTGQAVAIRPAVIVRDAFNNVKPGAVVTFATTAGNGSVTDETQTTNASGIATVGSWTLGNVGINTLRATVTGSGISGNPAVFTATATSGVGPPGLTLIASGLNTALYVTAPPGDTLRAFVVQQNGTIRILRRDTLLTTPFLDLSGIISCCGERGLLSMAFHPNYSSNGLFYVDYTDPNGDLTVARYQVSGDPNVADGGSGQVLLSIPHSSEVLHNGGLVTFGPDGYLYIGTGDGGGAGDPGENGQDSTVLLGKILRIDVDGAFPYAIPASNPFAGRSGADEVWAYGLRNPWRFSFDRLTQDLYIADVGEVAWEEIDFAPAGDPGGHNYGWDQMEGTHCYEPMTGCETSGKVLPVYEYSHASDNCSITGGYVYRGAQNPTLDGRYFFADYCVGRVRSLRMVAGVATDLRDHDEFGTLREVTSFGEDGRGELYITRASGQVYRITPQ